MRLGLNYSIEHQRFDIVYKNLTPQSIVLMDDWEIEEVPKDTSTKE